MEYKFTKLGFKESKNIKEAYWDNTNKVLKLVFHNNYEYLYFGLDFETIEKWFNSESVGSFFFKNIKTNSKIRYERIK